MGLKHELGRGEMVIADGIYEAAEASVKVRALGTIFFNVISMNSATADETVGNSGSRILP